MRIAWFTPVTGNEGTVHYSRAVLGAMTQLCEPVLYCNRPPEGFPPALRVVDLAVTPDGLTDLASSDALFYVLGNDLEQHGWIFEMARAHPGIVILLQETLHRFFLDYYVAHLRRPDLYITRMSEHYGVRGLAAAHLILGPQFEPPGTRAGDQDPFRYSFTEEALRSASGVVVHSRRHATLVREVWAGPTYETRLPETDASGSPDPDAAQTVQTYAHGLLRFAERDVPRVAADHLAEVESRRFAERIASRAGEILGSLGANPGSPGVEAVIAETGWLLSPRPAADGKRR